jgi:hypothetical protein
MSTVAGSTAFCYFSQAWNIINDAAATGNWFRFATDIQLIIPDVYNRTFMTSRYCAGVAVGLLGTFQLRYSALS